MAMDYRPVYAVCSPSKATCCCAPNQSVDLDVLYGSPVRLHRRSPLLPVHRGCPAARHPLVSEALPGSTRFSRKPALIGFSAEPISYFGGSIPNDFESPGQQRALVACEIGEEQATGAFELLELMRSSTPDSRWMSARKMLSVHRQDSN